MFLSETKCSRNTWWQDDDDVSPDYIESHLFFMCWCFHDAKWFDKSQSSISHIDVNVSALVTLIYLSFFSPDFHQNHLHFHFNVTPDKFVGKQILEAEFHIFKLKPKHRLINQMHSKSIKTQLLEVSLPSINFPINPMKPVINSNMKMFILAKMLTVF